MTGSGSKRIFLSYTRQQLREVEDVAAKLRAGGHTVFFDKKSLKGENFDERIRAEVSNCHLFVVFVSEASVRKGSYVLTELGYVEERWADPSRHVLAVRVGDDAIESVPAYLRANVTVHLGGRVTVVAAQQVPVSLMCEHCGKAFETSQGLAGHKRFCKPMTNQ